MTYQDNYRLLWALLSAILFVFDVLYSSAHYLSLFIVLEVYYNYHHICNTWLHAGAVGCSSELLLLCPMCSMYYYVCIFILQISVSSHFYCLLVLVLLRLQTALAEIAQPGDVKSFFFVQLPVKIQCIHSTAHFMYTSIYTIILLQQYCSTVVYYILIATYEQVIVIVWLVDGWIYFYRFVKSYTQINSTITMVCRNSQLTIQGYSQFYVIISALFIISSHSSQRTKILQLNLSCMQNSSTSSVKFFRSRIASTSESIRFVQHFLPALLSQR